MRRPYPALLSATALAAVSLLGLSACGGGSGAAKKAGPAAPAPSSAAPAPTTSAPAVDPASVKANELGTVPVFMYHQIVANPKGGYDQSPEEFRAEMERLVKENYQPIRASDYVAGKIDVPAGKTPAVMTFDDGTNSEFKLLPDGSVDPATAVGIMTAVAKEHPGWKAAGTMYVNASPFGAADPTQVFKKMAELGFEPAVHTVTHANLKALDDAGVQKELAQNLEMIEKAQPGVKVTTMALPFGVFPKTVALAHQGSFGGTTYSFAGVMLVGANPAPSPYAAKFDPLNIPRIRSAHRVTPGDILDSLHWLDYLAAHPTERYVSDGNAARVSFPKGSSAQPAAAFASQANPY